MMKKSLLISVLLIGTLFAYDSYSQTMFIFKVYSTSKKVDWTGWEEWKDVGNHYEVIINDNYIKFNQRVPRIFQVERKLELTSSIEIFHAMMTDDIGKSCEAIVTIIDNTSRKIIFDYGNFSIAILCKLE